MRRLAAGRAVVTVFFATLALAGTAAAAPGNFDAGFGSGGLVAKQFGQPDSTGYAIATQPDSKVIVAGMATDANGDPAGLVARFNPDGTLDQSFGQGGHVFVQVSLDSPSSPNTSIFAVALQPDGRILIGGARIGTSGYPQFFVARLNGADGGLDTSFGSGGVASKPVDLSAIEGLALQSNGDIVAAGRVIPVAKSELLVVRLKGGDGSFDAGFGTGGVKQLQIGDGATPSSESAAVALQPDGRIVVAGRASDTNDRDQVAVVRLLAADGSPDPSFGSAGVVKQQVGAGGAPSSFANGLAVQPDGKLVVAGRSSRAPSGSQALVMRLGAGDGAPDASFGTNGVRAFDPITSSDFYAEAYGVVIDPLGRIVIAGYAYENTELFMTARLRPADGSLDSSFGQGGVVAKQFGTPPNPYSDAYAVALQPNGGIVTTGYVTLEDKEFTPLTRQIGDLPPLAAFSAAPNPVLSGERVAFDAAGSSDSDGSLAGYSWDFGDGATGSGPTTDHVYAAPGAYTVRLTVTDDYGLTAETTQAITVNAPPVPLVPVVPQVPALSGLTIAPRAFAAAKRGSSIARRKVGATVRYRDSAAATTKFSVYALVTGVRKGKRCVKPGKRSRGKRCTRLVLKGTFTRADVKGVNRFRFTGRVKRRALPPGKYRLVAVPRVGSLVGAKRATAFRIVR